MGVEVGDAVRERLAVEELTDRYPVFKAVARRLWERLGRTDLDSVDRDQLRTVKGIGGSTARKINPPRSEAYRAREREVSDGALIPVYTDPQRNDKYRLVEENPDHARRRLRRAAGCAATVVSYL